MRASSRSCTQPDRMGSASMTKAVRSTSFMSTQPCCCLTAANCAIRQRASRAMRCWCCQASCWRRATSRRCSSGSASCAAGNFSRFFDRRSSLATNMALRNMSRRWFRSVQASASMMASAAFCGVLLDSAPKALARLRQRCWQAASCKASAGSANAASSGYACWNGGTEASTTPASSAKSNSTRLASAAASALCVCDRPWRATTAS